MLVVVVVVVVVLVGINPQGRWLLLLLRGLQHPVLLSQVLQLGEIPKCRVVVVMMMMRNIAKRRLHGIHWSQTKQQNNKTCSC